MWLNRHFYIIKGKINSCIYNSKTGDVFHIDNYNLFEILDDNITDIKIFDALLEHNILTNEKTNWNGDPKSINSHTDYNFNFAWIEITQNCNLKCVHCYNGKSFSTSNMCYNDFENVIDQLEALGIKRIQLIGGEPFLNPDIEKMLCYASRKMEFIEIFTNGTLVNDKIIELLKTKNIHLALSVYSYIEKMHNTVTQDASSFSRTIETIKKIQRNKIKYRVARVIIKGIELGDKNTELFTLSTNRDYVRLSGRANIKLYDEHMLLNKLITQRTFTKKVKLETFSENMAVCHCFAKNLYIDVNLNVFPCVMERRMTYGNLFSSSLKQLVEKSRIKFLTKDHIDDCKDCEFRYFCYDCRPDTLSECITSKPWFCTYNPSTGTWENPDLFIQQLLKRSK